MSAALRPLSLIVGAVGAGDVNLHELRLDAEHFGGDLAVHGVGADADVAHRSRQAQRAVRLDENLRRRFSDADVAIAQGDAATANHAVAKFCGLPLRHFDSAATRSSTSSRCTSSSASPSGLVSPSLSALRWRNSNGSRARARAISSMWLDGEHRLHFAGYAK